MSQHKTAPTKDVTQPGTFEVDHPHEGVRDEMDHKKKVEGQNQY